MKKFLLFFAGLLCTYLSSLAQIKISEIYVRPGNSQQEYFELVNAGPITESTGCYTLVTYFKNGSQRGMYVVSIPDIALAPYGLVTASSQAPAFSYQGGSGHADFSWNNGRVKRYLLQGGVLVADNTGAPYHDIFIQSGPSGGYYAVLLFKGNAVVDVLLGSYDSNTVPTDITSMGQLAAAGSNSCGGLTYNFANINAENQANFAHVNPSAGTNNGYYRNAFFSWEKGAALSETTPGAPNSSTGCPLSVQPLQVRVQCANDSTLGFTVPSGSSGAFPVTAHTYYDANGSQFLDAGDVLVNTRVLQQSDLGVAQAIAHQRGQEDFLVLLDAAGLCQDASQALNCPAAIILPVTLQSLNLQRSGNNVSLRWTTLTEMNNRGFYVQRLQGSGNWTNVTFIPSRATDGNSTGPLSYTFSDLNNFRGITQYRLRQVDIDGRSRYSDIRSTRGDGALSGLLLYPNPSRGVTHIQFADAVGLRDVQVTDMNGRVVKEWRSTGSQSLLVADLAPGVYAVRVIDQRDGWQETGRLLVSDSR